MKIKFVFARIFEYFRIILLGDRLRNGNPFGRPPLRCSIGVSGGCLHVLLIEFGVFSILFRYLFGVCRLRLVLCDVRFRSVFEFFLNRLIFVVFLDALFSCWSRRWCVFYCRIFFFIELLFFMTHLIILFIMFLFD